MHSCQKQDQRSGSVNHYWRYEHPFPYTNNIIHSQVIFTSNEPNSKVKSAKQQLLRYIVDVKTQVYIQQSLNIPLDAKNVKIIHTALTVCLQNIYFLYSCNILFGGWTRGSFDSTFSFQLWYIEDIPGLGHMQKQVNVHAALVEV